MPGEGHGGSEGHGGVTNADAQQDKVLEPIQEAADVSKATEKNNAADVGLCRVTFYNMLGTVRCSSLYNVLVTVRCTITVYIPMYVRYLAHVHVLSCHISISKL